MEPCLLNQTEAAEFIRMTVPTLKKLVKQGEVPTPWRHGRMIRYSRVALERWAERGEQIDHNSIAAIR